MTNQYFIKKLGRWQRWAISGHSDNHEENSYASIFISFLWGLRGRGALKIGIMFSIIRWHNSKWPTIFHELSRHFCQKVPRPWQIEVQCSWWDLSVLILWYCGTRHFYHNSGLYKTTIKKLYKIWKYLPNFMMFASMNVTCTIHTRLYILDS